jgi:hypothetical protein
MGLLSWNVVAFLDEATTQLLLRKVGGGYLFMHRLLLDFYCMREDSSLVGRTAILVGPTDSATQHRHIV